MAGKAHFKQIDFHDGIQTMELSSWKWFADYIQKELVDYKTYVFRGQRKSLWNLQSTLDRAIRHTRLNPTRFNYGQYLLQFQSAARGRRGINPQSLEENDWWALGQHHGLPTPLLDWTESPFLALFFAFIKPRERSTDQRAVWAISRSSVERKTKELAKATPPAEGVSFVFPFTDENARLVNQRGLFTRTPHGMALDEWVKNSYKGEPKSCILIKIVIPERKTDRVDCLKFLNRMNINHLTLFPDLYGSGKFCTMSLEIRNY